MCLDTSGPALTAGVKAKPVMLKPNEDEVEQLLGWKPAGKEEMLAAVERLVHLGSELVVMSLGAEGAVFCRQGEEVLWGKAAAEPLASTSGCGDALVAGVVACLLTNRSWEETVRWSIATATATAEIFGTGFPDEEHIRRVLPRVVVERLSPKINTVILFCAPLPHGKGAFLFRCLPVCAHFKANGASFLLGLITLQHRQFPQGTFPKKCPAVLCKFFNSLQPFLYAQPGSSPVDAEAQVGQPFFEGGPPRCQRLPHSFAARARC